MPTPARQTSFFASKLVVRDGVVLLASGEHSGLTKSGGRNNTGRITSRRRGGGHKRRYRKIDFKRHNKIGVPAKVAAMVKDGATMVSASNS